MCFAGRACVHGHFKCHRTLMHTIPPNYCNSIISGYILIFEVELWAAAHAVGPGFVVGRTLSLHHQTGAHSSTPTPALLLPSPKFLHITELCILGPVASCVSHSFVNLSPARWQQFELANALMALALELMVNHCESICYWHQSRGTFCNTMNTFDAGSRWSNALLSWVCITSEMKSLYLVWPDP